MCESDKENKVSFLNQVELSTYKTNIQRSPIALKRKEDVEPTLRKLKLAVLGGDFDEMLQQQVGVVSRIAK
jgi:hypothetical protein